MTADCLRLAPEIPEWRRSARFFMLAIALHAAVLFYPMKIAIGMLETPPPNTVIVRLEQAPPKPPSVPPRMQPAAIPPAQPKPRQRPAPSPRPVIAMAPAQSTAPATVTAPALAPMPVAAPPAAAPTASPAAAPAPSFSAARFDAAYLENPHPKYPPLSRRLGEEGKVLLKVHVSPDGQAATVDIEKSSNFVRLDEAARLAVSRWRFVPAKRGEKSVEASVIVPIVFRLDS